MPSDLCFPLGQTLLGYLKGPKPDVFYEFGPYFCAVALAISCVIQLSAINNGLKAEGALVRTVTHTNQFERQYNKLAPRCRCSYG